MSNNPFGDFPAWIAQNKANSLVAALALVAGVTIIPPFLTNAAKFRSVGLTVGIVIMLMWYWKWKEKGGKI